MSGNQIAELKKLRSGVIAFKPRQVILAEKQRKPHTMAAKQQTPLLHSVLLYLHKNHFNKSALRLLKESKIQDHSWKDNALDLEDIFDKYLQSCNHVDLNSKIIQGQAILLEGKKGREEDAPAAKDINGKKKKNKTALLDNVTELDGSLKEEINLNIRESGDAVDVTNHKKKKQKKNRLVTESINGDEKSSDMKSGLPEGKTNTSLSEEITDTKDKKRKQKKNRLVTESNGDETNSDVKSALPEEKPKTLLSEKITDTKDKKGKQKKTRLVTESINGDETNSDVKSGLPKGKTKTSPSEEITDAKDKKKKQKKNRLVTESTNGDETNSDMKSGLPEEKIKGSLSEEITHAKDKKGKNETTTDPHTENSTSVCPEVNTREKTTKKEAKEKKSLESSEVGAGNNQKAKKRKRSNEDEVQPAKETTFKDSKRRKSEGLEVSDKPIGANGLDKSGQRQERNDLCEPKPVNAFQRVKIDDVKFVDDRLQDNSYWAKNGAEKGYGAKAQEILGQVKGRDFRHEKTKKRGSYRGGQIDLDSHSIKFNYSNEE